MNKFLLISTCVAFSLQAVAQEVTRDETTDNKQKTDARVFFQGGKLHFAGPNENFHLWLDNRINLESAIYKPTESVDDLTSKVNKDLEDDDTHFASATEPLSVGLASASRQHSSRNGLPNSTSILPITK